MTNDIPGSLQTWLAGPAWVLAIAALASVIRQFVPWVKARNESEAQKQNATLAARRLEIEEEGALRTQLLNRIATLEENSAKDRRQWQDERQQLLTQIYERDQACEEQMKRLQGRIDSLERIISQNAQSGAQMLGDPAGFATTKAARKARGEDTET